MADVKTGEISQLLVSGSKKQATIDTALDSLFANAPPPAPVKPVVAPKAAAPAPVSKPEENDSTEKKRPKKPKKQADKADKRPIKKAEVDVHAKAKQERRKRHGIDDSDDEMEDAQEKPPAKKEKKNLLGRMPQDPNVLKRTLFIGNLSTKCITDKSVHSNLRVLCQTYGKIKAIRFRSIAFDELLPRKLAFIQGKFHSDRQVCNAYVEYMDEESAQKALQLNGTEFENKHIRVDIASNDKVHDSKRSVFVGNLDFAAEEEELWNHFGSCGTVENVRIIRDAKTNLGKGFAYVQFADRAAVSLALKLNGTEVNSRKLRVMRSNEKVLKAKQEAVEKEAAMNKILEGTRSVKGDKPTNKKRRTARSKSFAENRINSAKKPTSKPGESKPRKERSKPRKSA
ncbi:Nucleolar protein 12 [Coemansia sp. RSA 2336]|nr:Nucleolar protein 12 [Coemansia sp. RSA 2336]